MATHNPIDTPTKRKRLDIRREPYWAKIGKGQFLGFRATQSGGTWIARLGKTQTRLAAGADLTYSDALKASLRVFDQLGVVATRYTLGQCVEDYARHLELNNSPAAGADSRARLISKIHPPMLKAEVRQLSVTDIKRFLTSMVRASDDPDRVRASKVGANRVLAMLKAALNLAYRDQKVPSDQAWRAVRQFQGVNKPRDLYLTAEQVKALLDASTGAFHDLCKAAVLTGARYGELRAAKVNDLDPTRGTLRLTGKTGTRDCFLSRDALGFFNRLAQSKLPSAALIPNPEGGHWKHAQNTRYVNDVKVAAKLPAATVFYSLRHYYISRALLSGVNIKALADNCGTSVLMIERTYGKFQDTDRRRLMDQVEL